MSVMRVRGLTRIIIGFLLCVLSITTFARTTIITKVNLHSFSNKDRYTFKANSPIHFQDLNLKHPDRVVLDLYHAKLTTRLPQQQNTLIKKIRSARYNKKTWRIVFDLKHATKSRVIRLPGSHPYRIALDIYKPKLSLLRNASIVPTEIYSWHKTAAILTDTSQAIAHPRDIVVVIDPGHGGKDPGAIGVGGTHEKDVVLAIARDLKSMIDHQPGFKAVLTRRGDYFIPLRRRMDIARRDKADMFIAIHADAYRNKEARGVSVYALSSRGATSEAARWIALRENKSELMGGVDLNDKSSLLRSVLINLSQTATVRASLMIGKDIINSVSRITQLHHRKVEQAAFVVLKSPDIPSLLVETGFLSNRREEHHLNASGYRQQIALALMRGIKQYFSQRPPRNTWLALWRNHPRQQVAQYRVTRGDTLTGISDRYQVPLSNLISYNHLHSNNIHIGQVILIPKSV